MAIIYQCRHCKREIGQLDDRSVEAQQLGFPVLTNEERMDMIAYEHNGDMRVNVICEDCQEALERNPIYHQLDQFIQ